MTEKQSIDPSATVAAQADFFVVSRWLISARPRNGMSEVTPIVRDRLPHSSLARQQALLETLVKEATGSKVVSLHHDISTVTGEEVVVFTLAEAPIERAQALSVDKTAAPGPTAGKTAQSARRTH
jgi:hypothetical protein